MNGELYSSIAPIYDKANDDIDYAAWADFIEAAFDRFMPARPEEVLDLACGTGTMTLELARRGYDMTAVDLSVEMLGLARQKLADANAGGVLLLNQDMTALDLYGTVGAAVCCLDSINYLTDDGDLCKCFEKVHLFLEPDGLFIFDVNTPRKFAEVYGGNAYVFEEEGRFTVWQNDFDTDSGICTFALDSFTRQKDGRYLRVSETQCERSYSRGVITDALTRAGMKTLAVVSDYRFTEADNGDMRWYFIARAIK